MVLSIKMEFILIWIEAIKSWTLNYAWQWVDRIWSILLKGLIIVGGLLALAWSAAMLYGTFHFFYMPFERYEYPLHLKFSTDCDSLGPVCSFPTGNITFTEDGLSPILYGGQGYRVTVELDLPESPTNQQLGMFLVSLKFYTLGGKEVNTISKTAMLRYRSWLLTTLRTLVLSPLLIFDVFQQRQTTPITMHETFFDSPYAAATGAVVVVESRHLQLYSASLTLEAEFSGLRYLLFHYPVTAAVCGFISNFILLSLFLAVSWQKMWIPWTSLEPPVRVGYLPRGPDGAATYAERREQLREDRPEEEGERSGGGGDEGAARQDAVVVKSPVVPGKKGHQKKLSWTEDVVHVYPSRLEDSEDDSPAHVDDLGGLLPGPSNVRRRNLNDN